MYDSQGSAVDYLFKSSGAELIQTCREQTNLSESNMQLLRTFSYNLEIVHQLEGGDIFIDCLTCDRQAAVVVAQFSPQDTNYTRKIVGELMLRDNEPGVFRTLEVGAPSRKLKAVVTGENLIRQNVSPIRNKMGDVIGALIVERRMQGADLWEDNNMEQQAHQLLQTTYDEREMERVAENMKDGIVRFNQQGIAVYANLRARFIFQGIKYMDNIVGMHFENLAFGSITFRDIEQKGRSSDTGVAIGDFILNVVYAPIVYDQFCGAVMLIEDTTEEKNIEKELVLKSAAIDEIHHRVKNNLQTIISLLHLQRRRIENAEARQAFAETISRVFSISLTHEILAQKGVDLLDLKDVLERMLDNVKGYIIPMDLELEMHISGDNLLLKSNTATSIALVVNELIQNSIKHAFTGRTRGRLALSIKKGDEYSSISVEDDGVGYQNDSIRDGSLGHKLVFSLVQDKLMGNIDIVSAPGKGTKVLFDFQNDSEGRRKKNADRKLRRLLSETE